MKKPEEIKPTFTGKITTLGNSKGIAIPKWFIEQWGLEKGKEYKVEIKDAVSAFLSHERQLELCI
jgi:antitoxin component of MazEF toxin-antitoxin module